MELDITDRKLLYYLDKNTRQGISALARKLRIGRNVALYRLNKMKKEGVIKGSFAEINNAALGYHSFRIFFKLGNAKKREYEELFHFITNHKNIFWFSRVLGKWDLDIVFMTKEISEFELFRKDLCMRFNNLIEDSEIALLTQIYHYPRDYLLSHIRKNTNASVFDINIKSTYKPDKKDEELLLLLTKDASMNISEIAYKLKLSVNTTKKRIKNLEKNNILLGYRLFIDSEKTGYEHFKLHISLRHYKKEDITRLREWLAKKSFVLYTDHFINGEDFEIELLLKQEKDYIHFLDELNSHFGNIIKDHFLIKFYDVRVYKYFPANLTTGS